jgi:hypothetical protein
MYTSCELLNAVLAWIRSRASAAVTMDLPARCARFTIVTRGLAASGGGGLLAASPVAGPWFQACSSMSPPDLRPRYWVAADSEHAAVDTAHDWLCSQLWTSLYRAGPWGPAHCRMYLTQPRFCLRDRSRMPVCPLSPGMPFALQAPKCDLVFLDPAVRRDPADAFHVQLPHSALQARVQTSWAARRCR